MKVLRLLLSILCLVITIQTASCLPRSRDLKKKNDKAKKYKYKKTAKNEKKGTKKGKKKGEKDSVASVVSVASTVFTTEDDDATDLSMDWEEAMRESLTEEILKSRNADSNKDDAYAWIVIENGKIVSEYYDKDIEGWGKREPDPKDNLFHLWSVTKLFTGIVLAMIDKQASGSVADMTLGEILKPNSPPTFCDNSAKMESFKTYLERNPDKSRITVRELLKMSSGLYLPDPAMSCYINWNQCGNVHNGVVEEPEYKPKEKGDLQYLTANNILSYVIMKLTDEGGGTCYGPADIARDYIFRNLGMANFNWWYVKEKNHKISTSLHGSMLKLRDMAKMGQFALQGGRFGPGLDTVLADWWFDDELPTVGEDGYPDFGFNTYNAGFYYKHDTDDSYVIEGMNGKHLFWQRKGTSERVIAIICLDNLIDYSQGGQYCYGSYCQKYTMNGESAAILEQGAQDNEVFSAASGGLNAASSGLIKDSFYLRERIQELLDEGF